MEWIYPQMYPYHKIKRRETLSTWGTPTCACQVPQPQKQLQNANPTPLFAHGKCEAFAALQGLVSAARGNQCYLNV
jgi:hypothetical protein